MHPILRPILRPIFASDFVMDLVMDFVMDLVMDLASDLQTSLCLAPKQDFDTHFDIGSQDPHRNSLLHSKPFHPSDTRHISQAPPHTP